MFCTKCGNECKEGAKFCNKCGAPLETIENEPVKNETIKTENIKTETIKTETQPEPKDNKNSLVIALSVTAAVLAAAVIIICIFAFTGVFKKKEANEEPVLTQQNTESETESIAAQIDKDDDMENLGEKIDFGNRDEKETTQEFSYIDLNGLSYEHRMDASGSIYECSGLAETTGVFKEYTWDLDADGDYEQLVFSLDYNAREGTHFITMSIYEEKDGKLVKSDSAIPVPYIFYETCDSCNIQFFIKDDKYLCIADETLCYLEADGAIENMDVFTYDGKYFEQYAHCDYAGSDWDGVGPSEKEFCDKCEQIGLNRTAHLLYKTGHFYFSTVDDGLQCLFKIRGEIEGEFYDPVLTTRISFIDAVPASDYIFEDSAKRLLSKSELSGLSKEECRIARNEIYARNAWNFEDEGLAAYFAKKAWYRTSCGTESITDSDLNETERSNIRLIKEVEAEK